jgi:pimeloyl-ACP methyl ester carboxylesterase
MDDYFLYRREGNRRVCILVHGLGGSNDSSYWGALAELLRYESAIADLDICFWKYPSSQSPFANLLAVARKGRTVGDVDEVAQALTSCIDSLVSQYQYQSVLLAGHSLGGAICLLSTKHQLDRGHTAVTHVCLMGTPQTPSALARLAAGLFRWNPHIRWLGSRLVSAMGDVALPALRQSSVHTTYVHYTRDELMKNDEDLEFDARESVDGAHTWTSSVRDKRGAPYRTLRDWLTRSARSA